METRGYRLDLNEDSSYPIPGKFTRRRSAVAHACYILDQDPSRDRTIDSPSIFAAFSSFNHHVTCQNKSDENLKTLLKNTKKNISINYLFGIYTQS